VKDESLRILLVDDDEDEFILTRELVLEFERGRADLEWVGSFEMGLSAMLEARHEAILVDYRLGGRDGLELLREAQRLGCRAPIILLTGQGNQDTDIAAMHAGAADYLVKGQVAPVVLERTIRHAVERGRTLEALRASENLNRAIISALEEGIVLQGNDGKLLSCNASAERILEGNFAELAARKGRILAGPLIREDGSAFPEGELPSNVARRTGEPRADVVGIERSDGTQRWLSINSQPLTHPDRRDSYGVVTSLFDFTDRKRAEERLLRQTMYDALTELPNRQLFTDRLEQVISFAHRVEGSVAVAFLDLDRFKTVNDMFGHASGDALLQEVARRLVGAVRPDDTVARLGSDEFTLILANVQTAEDMAKVAQKILEVFEIPFEIGGQELKVNASLGLSLHPSDGKEADTLLRHADVAMRRAKQSGRGHYQFYRAEMTQIAHEQVALEAELRKALETNSLELHYQPQYDLTSNALVGVEALLRWNHPTLGAISPARFIPIAEESGLIVPIGTWVLNEACRQNAEWQRAGIAPHHVAVNVSSMQFERSDLVETVGQALGASGLEPRWLELELTESLVMRDVTDTIRQLERVRELWIAVAVDDFGTGYSSLAYLQRLPLDTLKIDRAFVMELRSERNTLPLVRALVTLAHGLGMRVVAEGIETTNQLEMLRDLACNIGQGFLLARPMAASRLLEWIGRPAVGV
jgi:diguanylate cyclase (GGDEF)-like protein/PAS domain S-box-containing protein